MVPLGVAASRECCLLVIQHNIIIATTMMRAMIASNIHIPINVYNNSRFWLLGVGDGPIFSVGLVVVGIGVETIEGIGVLVEVCIAIDREDIKRVEVVNEEEISGVDMVVIVERDKNEVDLTSWDVVLRGEIEEDEGCGTQFVGRGIRENVTLASAHSGTL